MLTLLLADRIIEDLYAGLYSYTKERGGTIMSMSNILEFSTISDWASVITLLLAIGGIYTKAKKARIEILQQLRAFRWKLEYVPQENSEANVMLIQNEMLDYLYKVKSNMIFSSSFHPFRYKEEIFSMACQKYVKHIEGVTFEDVRLSTISLIDELTLFLSAKM